MIHVLDCLNGYLVSSEYAYKRKYTFNSWNIAPPLNNQINVFDLTKKILHQFKKKIKLKYRKKKFL